MSTQPRRSDAGQPPAGQRPARGGVGGEGARETAMGNVFSLDYLRILQALGARSRYRYVQPRVLRERAGGWRIVSPNCSRNVDPEGGEIPIAWLEPQAGDAAAEPRWRLHWCDHRDHPGGRWCVAAEGLSLSDALARLCTDPGRVFWP